MKKALVLAVILASSSAYAPALAGGCGCGGGGGGGGPAVRGEEFASTNQCPLAQETKSHRSLGQEAFACSTACRDSLTANLLLTLKKV